MMNDPTDAGTLGGTRGCAAPAAPRVFVSLLLAGCLAPAPAAAQTLSERYEPLALTATEPELSGSVYIGGDPQADNHRTPLPDGTPLRAQQVPRFLRPAHDGPFGFDDFLVIGDHPTVTFERIDWDEDTPTAWRRETWRRASTRTVTGRLVSVFHPRWPADLLRRRLRRGRWGVDLPELYWGRLLLPGRGGESRRVTLNIVPPNIPPSPVVRINDSVQYASHVVNIRVPDFGDSRIEQGELSLNLAELTRQFFYEHFADEYELIAVVTDANQLSRWGGAHTKRRNDISGIGLPLFDNSGYHGSEGVLQAVETWDGGRAWSSWRGVLHETGHQYGEYSKVWDSLRPPLVRRGHNPWGHTPLLYPGAVAYGAVLYGNRRVARIRSAGRPDRFEIEPTLPLFTYHPLTLYRMGLLPASEVPDMLVFHDQGQFNPSSNASPRPGTAVTGGAAVVTIDDLIAADGVREGPVVTEIRRATVYVSRERLVPKEQMDVLNYFARRLGATSGVTSWDRRPSFAEATRGGAVMTTDIRPLGRPAAGPGPAEVTCAKVGTTALVGVVLDREVGGCLRTGDTLQVSGRLTLGDRPDYDRVCIRFMRYPDADPQDRVFECAPLDAGNRFALEATLHRPGGYQMEAFARWPGSGWQRPLTSYSGAVEVRDADRNRAPRAVGALEDRTLTVGGSTLVVDVSRAFSDPDGDVLTYAAVSSSPGVAAAVLSGNAVTLAPVRPGSATVTVIATDPDGLTAAQTFAVTVAPPDNRPPVAVGTLAPLTIGSGEPAVSVDVAAAFRDPDGDLLTYTATSSAPAVASVSTAGSMVTLAPVRPGSATVTVTATDPDGLTAAQTFAVTVAPPDNRPPVAVGTLAPLTIGSGEPAVSVDVAAAFRDPDGDLLTYTATSSAPAVASVSTAGSMVTLAPVRPGSATVTVTATDPDGLTAAQTFAVTVAPPDNRPPVAVGTLAPLTIGSGEPAVSVDVAAAFRDPDGDLLTYTAASSAPAVASVSTAGSMVTLAPVRPGSATVTVTATDPDGLTAAQTFAVTVAPPDNRPPVAVGTLAPLTIGSGEPAVSVDVAAAFRDPDGDLLTYTATSSAPAVASVSTAGSMVTLAPVRPGSATVTVTATDPDGLTAAQTFAVTVAARAAFTDHPIRPGVTPIKAVHFIELRARIDALRARSRLPAFPWTDPALVAGVTPVRRVHLTELRSSLDAVYDAAGLLRPAYADTRAEAGATPIKAAHIMELRAAVLQVE